MYAKLSSNFIRLIHSKPITFFYIIIVLKKRKKSSLFLFNFFWYTLHFIIFYIFIYVINRWTLMIITILFLYINHFTLQCCYNNIFKSMYNHLWKTDWLEKVTTKALMKSDKYSFTKLYFGCIKLNFFWWRLKKVHKNANLINSI